jgi:hypothetical protein
MPRTARLCAICPGVRKDTQTRSAGNGSRVMLSGNSGGRKSGGRSSLAELGKLSIVSAYYCS